MVLGSYPSKIINNFYMSKKTFRDTMWQYRAPTGSYQTRVPLFSKMLVNHVFSQLQIRLDFNANSSSLNRRNGLSHLIHFWLRSFYDAGNFYPTLQPKISNAFHRRSSHHSSRRKVLSSIFNPQTNRFLSLRFKC